MDFEAFLNKHTNCIKGQLNWLYRKFDIPDYDQPTYRQNAYGDLFFKMKNRKDLHKVKTAYVMKAVRMSAVNTFYGLQMMLKNRGKGCEEVAETTFFSENPRITQNPEEFYGSNGVYKDRGTCSFFNENPIHTPFPGCEDLSEDDLAVIKEFCDPQVEDRTRRAILRRRVDLILLELGIDSSDVREYTSRNRERRGNSGTS